MGGVVSSHPAETRECGLPFFEARNVCLSFGGLNALADVNMTVAQGEIHGIIGPNGAGKTSFFNVVTGVYRPQSGKISFLGEDIAGKRADVTARKGLVRTFQAVSLFADCAVLEHVMVGSHLDRHAGLWRAIVGVQRARSEEQRLRQEAREILQFLGIAHLETKPARSLGFGHKRILGLATALAAHPRLLLVDECLGGMNPKEVDAMIDVFRRLQRERGITVIIIEHNVRAMGKLCDKVDVLNFGRNLCCGTPDQVRQNPEVIEAYLGKE